MLINTISLAIAEAGIRAQPSSDSPVVSAAPEEAVRSRYYARTAEQAEPGKDVGRLAVQQRQAFRRAVNGALNAMHVMAAMHNGERVLWVP